MQIQAPVSTVFQSVTYNAYVSNLWHGPLTNSTVTSQCMYFSYSPVTHKVDTVHGATVSAYTQHTNKPSPSVW